MEKLSQGCPPVEGREAVWKLQTQQSLRPETLLTSFEVFANFGMLDLKRY